jgi:hypothetical protein
MNITRIIEEFEKGNICVFKDENAARQALIQYSMLGNSIEQDRAISYKVFQNYFVEDKKDKEEVTSVMRLLFVTQFLKNNHLSYFISDQYSESIDRLSVFVSKILPSLKRLKENAAYDIIPEAMKSDVELLYAKYNEFLNSRNLYEPFFNSYKLEYAEKSVLKSNYSIICDDTIPDLQRFLEVLNNPDNIKLIHSLSVDGTVKLEKFKNCAEENSFQIRRIYHLLSSGVNVEDVAITLAKFDNQIDDIEREANKYGIPINCKAHKLLKIYPAGKYFSRLNVLFKQRFSLSYMKEFFLDRSLPFKERGNLRNLIRIGIDTNISHGQISGTNDSWEQKLDPSKKIKKEERELYTSLLDFYKEFKDAIIMLNSAKTKTEVIGALEVIETLLFDESLDEFDGTKDSYKKVMNEFVKFFNDMEKSGIDEQDNLYSWLISQLDDVSFSSPQEMKSEGINIYSYPDSSALNVAHHFILGVNHAATESIYKPLDILPSSIEESMREEENLTSAILNDYITAEGNVYVSYGEEDYSGSCLPPSFFIERGLVAKSRLDIPCISNPYRDEEMFFGKIADGFDATPLQRAGFYRANENILSETKFNMTSRKVDRSLINRFLSKCVNDRGEIKLSSTSIDTYKTCPYKWSLRYIMNINDDPFDIVPLDHREVGSFLHKVMEVFFKKVNREDNGFFSSRAEIYEEWLSQIFDEELYNYSQSDKSPTPSSVIYIYYTFKPRVMNIIANECDTFDGLKSHGYEEYFEVHDSIVTEEQTIPYYIKGMIDRIVTLQDSGYAVVDYKKGSATIKEKSFRKGIEETGELKSYQFPCYRKLMKSKNMDAKIAAYYGFNDGKYEFVFGDDEAFHKRMDEIFDEVVKQMLISIKDGDFKTTPSKENCAMCPFRQICRKRYSTK